MYVLVSLVLLLLLSLLSLLSLLLLLSLFCSVLVGLEHGNLAGSSAATLPGGVHHITTDIIIVIIITIIIIRMRPISLLRLWMSEDLPQAEYQCYGVKLSCP